MGKHIRIYNPPTADAWRMAVELAAVEAARDQGWEATDEPIELNAIFFMPRPKAHYRAAKPAPWVLCECCEDYLCNIHKMHVFDCDCPSVEEWIERNGISPYEQPQRELKPNAPLYCGTKPDLSNIIKGTEDALEQSGVIARDQLIVALHCVKLYAGEEDVGATLTLSKAVSRTKADNHG